jgi:predicted permease
VNRCFSSERPNFSVFSFYFHPSGNKTKLLGARVLVGVKTPIHLFTYSPFFGPSLSGNKIEKWKISFWSELKHLFTYPPIHLFWPPSLSGNKIEKWKISFWSELKHLFTYPPIHLFWPPSLSVNKIENGKHFIAPS